ncbi:MAG: DUF2752 domain-containing protein [Flavobacteriia bacterium]|nr:DUF2752 domain-containing protein [Flavobacteriia bacterium]
MIKNKGFLLFLFPVIIVIGAFYYFYNPENSPYFFKCPFKLVTGLSCPGCGSQRAVHALLHLNFKEAFHFNPLLIASIPYAGLGIAFNAEVLKSRFPKTRNLLYGSRAMIAVLVIVVLFFIFRNI